MTEVARNLNIAFDRGHQEAEVGCQTWQNPYQARYARNAWRAGWEKYYSDLSIGAVAVSLQQERQT